MACTHTIIITNVHLTANLLLLRDILIIRMRDITNILRSRVRRDSRDSQDSRRNNNSIGTLHIPEDIILILRTLIRAILPMHMRGITMAICREMVLLLLLCRVMHPNRRRHPRRVLRQFPVDIPRSRRRGSSRRAPRRVTGPRTRPKRRSRPSRRTYRPIPRLRRPPRTTRAAEGKTHTHSPKRFEPATTKMPRRPTRGRGANPCHPSRNDRKNHHLPILTTKMTGEPLPPPPEGTILSPPRATKMASSPAGQPRKPRSTTTGRLLLPPWRILPLLRHRPWRRARARSSSNRRGYPARVRGARRTVSSIRGSSILIILRIRIMDGIIIIIIMPRRRMRMRRRGRATTIRTIPSTVK
mmetsp:Transcript_23645/g.50064  ORF Transcript_23645/g.50064 Transcript_23645/m.50064 type:complete len:356 (+) Transcript_23645:849-1916(+)